MSNLKKLEQGRAEFAYNAANQNITLKNFVYNSITVQCESCFREAFEKKFKTKLENNEENKKSLNAFLAAPVSDGRGSTNFVKDLIDYYHKYGKEYKSYVKKIPMLIKTNGLGATFAFIKAKSKDGNAFALIYSQTTQWLRIDNKLGVFNPENTTIDLVNVFISQESTSYRALTVEVLTFFAWLKRFSEGLIEGEADSNGGED